MSEVVTRQETFIIGGLGDEYENQCQRMLWRGVAFLTENKPPVEMWENAKTYSNIVGVMQTDGEDLHSLEHAIMKPGEGVSGAQHQFVMQHLWFIHNNGVEKWREELRRIRPEDEFVWEGAL